MNMLHQLVQKRTWKEQLDSSTSAISTPSNKRRPRNAHFENTLFDSIAEVLVKHKLEDDKVEAARLVAAASLSCNLNPPISEGFLPADSTQLHDPEEPEPEPESTPMPPPLPPRKATYHENSPVVRRRAPGGGEEAQTHLEMEAESIVSS